MKNNILRRPGPIPTTCKPNLNLLKTLIFSLLIFTMLACKKTEVVKDQEDINTEKQIEQSPGENYNVSDELVWELDWQIVGRWDYDQASRRVWKLQGQTSLGVKTNNYILITEVPDTLYWKAGYQRWDVLDGVDVSLLIKSSIPGVKSHTSGQ